jgi:ATP-dependent Lon protease
MLLDEIDMIRANVGGDPTSILLVILDPHWNKMINDEYLKLVFHIMICLWYLCLILIFES